MLRPRTSAVGNGLGRLAVFEREKQTTVSCVHFIEWTDESEPNRGLEICTRDC
jgi:hypothetical protein